MLLSGKSMIITGGSRGIGRDIALLLAQNGARVALVARNAGKLAEVCEEIAAAGGEAIGVPCDISHTQCIPDAIAAVLARYGRIDALVNNAGVSDCVRPEDITEQMWDRLMDVNLKAVFFWSQAVYRQLLAQGGGGTLIHVASIGGQRGAKWSGAHYCASKGGVIAMSKALAVCGAEFKITSNVICPGLIETDMAKELGFVSEEAAQSVPLCRLGTGMDIAGAVLYLASEYASYLTGATIDVNGGLYLR